MPVHEPMGETPAGQCLSGREDVLLAVIESTAAPVFSVDTEGRYTSFNSSHAQTMRALYGVEIQLGASLTGSMTVEADRAAAWTNIRRALGGEQFVVAAASGDDALSRRFFEISHNPLRDQSGRVTGVAVFAEDLTERRAAEKALRESENQLRQMFDHMSSGVAIYEAVDEGADFIIKEFNPAAERSTNRQRGEVVGRRVTQVFPDVAEFGLLEVLTRVWMTGTPERHPSTLYQDDRLTFWAENYVYRVPSGEIVAIFDDITHRKLAESALRESEAMLSSFYDSSPLRMGVVEVLDDDLLFVSGNRALAETLQRPEGRIRNLLASELGHLGRSIGSLAIPFRTAAASGRPTSLDYESSAGDGEWRHATVSPMVVPPGARPRLAFAIEDITDRRRVEQERLDLERQFQQSQRLESLGVLAGGIAHDFNNILMAVLGHAELALAELSPSTPVRNDILEIVQASHRAAGLCRQMLAYSGRGQFVVEPIDLSSLVEDMLNLLQSAISKKALLDLSLEKHLPPLQGDASQLSQVIMNLVINASEAIGEKSGVITISAGAVECTQDYLRETYAEQHLPPGLYVSLEVSDTGVGMDTETQERIFEPFFTTKFTGRGLGLSAVLGIVRGHKGALRLRTQPGRGTTFQLLFPAADPGADAALHTDGASTDDWRGKGTVLVVDDEEAIRALGRRMIESLGFRVLVAPDGREALDVYRAHSGEIVLVLLDLTMPHMDGEEAFRELRRLDPDVRVIISSGYAESDVASRFAGAGLVGFVTKPYTLADLRERMRAALDVPSEPEGCERG